MKRVLVVNNRDSFVYNLVEYLRRLVGDRMDVCLVDNLYTAEWEKERLLSYSHVLFSPGAGVPSEYPGMMQLLGDIVAYAHVGEDVPSVLGVCLGHQAIAAFFGANLRQMEVPKHGHMSQLRLVDPAFFLWDGVPANSGIARYHSWIIEEKVLPIDLEVLAYDEDNNIMAIQHMEYPIYGVQFHPESILTKYGMCMLESWIKKELPK